MRNARRIRPVYYGNDGRQGNANSCSSWTHESVPDVREDHPIIGRWQSPESISNLLALLKRCWRGRKSRCSSKPMSIIHVAKSFGFMSMRRMRTREIVNCRGEGKKREVKRKNKKIVRSQGGSALPLPTSSSAPGPESGAMAGPTTWISPTMYAQAMIVLRRFYLISNIPRDVQEACL